MRDIDMSLASTAVEAIQSDAALEHILDMLAAHLGAIQAGIIVTDSAYETRQSFLASHALRNEFNFISDLHLQKVDGDDAEGVQTLARLPRNKVFAEADI